MLLNPRYEDRFKQQYLEYLADLSRRGVSLAIGSDCHDRHYTAIDFEKAAAMLESVGLDADECWRLPPVGRSRDDAPSGERSGLEA